MTLSKWKLVIAGSVIHFSLISPAAVVAGPMDQAASDLITFLNYRGDRPGKGLVLLGVSGCGHFKEDRDAAISLVKLGTLALPNIEEALDSIENVGKRSEFAFNGGWLTGVYAKIKGPEALPRIRSMLANPNLDFLRLDLDRAVALSLNITSYVSGSRTPMRVFHCGRSEEPRDALDKLILAWESNDRQGFEASLGPSARGALDRLFRVHTWESLRSELWHVASSVVPAIGYQLRFGGKWSQPEETLEQETVGRRLSEDLPTLELEIALKNSVGVDCGTRRVQFLKADSVTGGYLIDSPDLRDLLHSISACAAQTGGR
jgi:hypothetical protein